MTRAMIRPSTTFAVLVILVSAWPAPDARADALADDREGNPPGPSLAAPDRAPGAERVAAQRAHLWRSAAWGGASIALGGALVLSSERAENPTRWAFGVETGLWGAIDLAISAAGLILLGDPSPDESPGERLGRERAYHDVLLLTIGLDLAYIAAGSAVVLASHHGVDDAGEWRGHGAGIIVQGLGLLTLEGLALLGSRRRLGRILEARRDFSLSPAPLSGGWGVTLGGRW